MNLLKFSETITIKETAEKVFDYTQDYNKRLLWDTFLKRADLIEGAVRAEKGIKAYCVARNGLGMETEYISFNRPQVTAVKMTKGPFMFKSFLGSWTFKEISKHETDVIFLYSFSLRFPFYIFGMFIKSILRNNVKQRLIDLKNCIEKESTKR